MAVKRSLLRGLSRMGDGGGGIPLGVIGIWTGTLATIPAGWNLCDGGGGRPNLLTLFVRGSAAGVNPGGTGGSNTHSHTEAGTGGAHNHGGTSGSGGAHIHTTPTTTGSHTHGTTSSGPVYVTQINENNPGGDHNHTWTGDTGAHTHSVDSQGAHSHTPTSTDNGRPAYYDVAFIYSDGTPANFAAGIIMLWSDVLGNIPAGWNLCEGTPPRPNLVARFLQSVPAATDPGATGGLDNHTHAALPAAGAHQHTLAAVVNHTHTSDSGGSHGHGLTTTSGNGSAYYTATRTNAGGHTHTCGDGGTHSHTTTAGEGSHTHVMNTADGRPPFRELAPIYASGGQAMVTGLIGLWTGILANIPVGWTLCDGGGSRPDMRSRFHRGVNTALTNPGTPGGFATHTHTAQADAGHTHTMNTQGAHTHTAVSGSWSHSHPGYNQYGTSYTVQDRTPAGANHNHGALSNTGGHSNHSVTSGAHSDHTYNTASSLPTYYDVAFIYKN